MQVKDIMTDDVQFVDQGTSVREVAKLMKTRECGSIPVGSDEKLIGMITDRDIVLRCVADGQDPAIMTAKRCMSPGILYCFDTDDVDDVLGNMGEQRVRRLPVVNADKKLVGIVSIGDLSSATENKACCGEAMEKIHEAA